jgi:hypothetical protein
MSFLWFIFVIAKFIGTKLSQHAFILLQYNDYFALKSKKKKSLSEELFFLFFSFIVNEQ